MKKLTVAAVSLLLFLVFLLPIQAETLFHDDFSDGDNWKDNWYHLGSEGGEILQVDGHLELDASELAKAKQISAITEKKFDFTNGITYEAVMTSCDAETELQFHVGQSDGKGQPEDDIWFTVNWVRVMLHHNSIYLQGAKPAGEGMPLLPEGEVKMEAGTPYKISLYMESTKCKLYVDGEKIYDGEHKQNFSKGPILLGEWTASANLEGNMVIDDAFVYEGDYDPNPPSMSVKSEGKLAARWGSIKVQY